MNHPLRNLKKEAMLLRLSHTEEEIMRANIMARVGASARIQEAGAPRGVPGLYYFFSPQFAMPLAALLILVLSGGTAFAAHGSLPGDALYTIKTKVSEPIQGALAFSTEDKIKFHAEVAQTRIEEAEMLASQNRLDKDAAAQIESSLDAHLSQRDELALKLDEEHPGASSDVSAQFNSSIAAHGDVLAALGGESSSSTTRENSDALVTKVRVASASNGTGARIAVAMAKNASATAAPQATVPSVVNVSLMAAEEAQTGTSANLTASSAPSASSGNATVSDQSQTNDTSKSHTQSREEKDARALGARATSSQEKLQRSVEALRGKIEDDVEIKLDTRLGRIASLIAEGQASISAGEFDAAKTSFNEALDRGTTLSTFISANARFDSGILRNLLGHDSRWGNDEE